MTSLQYSRVLALPPALRSFAITLAAVPNASHSPLKTSRSLSTTIQRSTAATNSASSPTQSSVSHTEVSHFNALASSWWDPHGPSRVLHLMNPLRHIFIRQCLNSHIRDTSNKLRYLDVGCGGGIFAESAARLEDTHSVTAIDPTPEVIAVARQHQRQDPLLLEEGRLAYQNVGIESLPIPTVAGEGYDVLTLFEVVEHIRQPSPFLQSCIKLVKPGGWLIGSTIARTNTSWFTTKFMAEDVLRMVPRGTHDWNQYIQPHELRDWARSQPELDAEFQGWQVMGVVYVPGFGWKEVPTSEEWGNYFFGIKKSNADN